MLGIDEIATLNDDDDGVFVSIILSSNGDGSFGNCKGNVCVVISSQRMNFTRFDAEEDAAGSRVSSVIGIF